MLVPCSVKLLDPGPGTFSALSEHYLGVSSKNEKYSMKYTTVRANCWTFPVTCGNTPRSSKSLNQVNGAAVIVSSHVRLKKVHSLKPPLQLTH